MFRHAISADKLVWEVHAGRSPDEESGRGGGMMELMRTPCLPGELAGVESVFLFLIRAVSSMVDMIRGFAICVSNRVHRHYSERREYRRQR